MPSINTYSVTNYIASNTVVNRAIMELGGYAAPNVMMANNKVEARERAEKAAMFFGFSMVLPIACTSVLNKIFLKYYGITDKYNKPGSEIIQLSRKYLTKDADYMLEGINLLKKDLKNKKNYENIEKGIDHIVNKLPKEELKTRLIKANNKVLVWDFLLTGASMSSIYWISNFITKLKTGRDGFSAEFEMADKEIIDAKAKKYKDRQKKNFVIAFGILALSGLSLSAAMNKGMLSKNLNSKFSNFIKKHANKFDYKDGIYMSRLTLFLIAILGDVPSTLLASRDKEELRYNIIKNSFFNGLFFGGDLLLNNIAAHTLDKKLGTSLVNKENLKPNASLLKKMTCPLYSLKELNSRTDLNPSQLALTKKYAVRMFWGNFTTILLILGFGTPILLNKIVKKNVEKDVEKYEQEKNRQTVLNNQNMDNLNKPELIKTHSLN